MIYHIIMPVIWLVYRIVYRMRCDGRENIPAKGAVIICSNHIHAFDPVTIAVTQKRTVHFMAKKELFKGKAANFFLRGLNSFPVDREANDITAYKTVMSLLKRQKAVGIFAQGTRMKETDAKNAKSGAALFALKCNAAVVPAYISSSYKPFSKMTVRYGKPISLEGYQNAKVRTELLDEITKGIMAEINKLAER